MLRKSSFYLMSLALSLLLLEIGLRLLGWGITLNQKRLNNDQDQQKYRIITLGESTTADGVSFIKPWPRLLEDYLNEEVSDFQVINRAQHAVTSPQLIQRFIKDIEIDKPDMVIAMMGINDRPVTWLVREKLTSSDSFIENLRILKLYRFIKSYWTKQEEEKIPKPRLPEDNLNHPDWKNLVQKIKVSKDFNHPDVESFLEDKNEMQRSQFYVSLAKAVQPWWTAPVEEQRLTYELLRKSLKHTLRIQDSPQLFLVLSDLFQTRNDCVWLASRFVETQELPTDAELGRMSGCVNDDPELAKKFHKAFLSDAFDDEPTTPRMPTKSSFQLLYKTTSERDICLILVQYPRRDVSHLKDLIGETGPKIFFVENKDNFEQALKVHGDEKIFTDHFAGDFGHTTELGHQFLAKNIFIKVKEALTSGQCGQIDSYSKE